MEQKPVYYDGSGLLNQNLNNQCALKLVQITPDMRKNIGCNPYHLENLNQK